MRKRTSKIWDIKTEDLLNVVSNSMTLGSVLKKFNIKANAKNRIILRKRCKEDNINIDHIPIGIKSTKGMKFTEQNKERTIKLIETKKYLSMNDTAARRKIKEYLIYKHGHKCSICGIETWNGLPVPLVCDHIDGNYENRDISNFRNVCCNCDAQLPTYKSKNKGKGDRYNREYYRRRKLEIQKGLVAEPVLSHEA